MIVSYHDKPTRDFAAGKTIKAFAGIEQASRLKIDRLEAASLFKTLLLCQAIVSKRLKVIARDNTASASTTNGGFASNGRKNPPDPRM